MENSKKIKIFLALAYTMIISIFLWVFLNKYSISEITTYEFIKINRDYLINIKNSNYFLILFIFLLLTIVWVLLLGFGMPICLLGGFIFDKWFGTLFVLIGLCVGATFLYIFANFFLKDFIENKFSKKFISLNEKFKKNEFNFFLIYRFVGGIPFSVSNILPVLFDVKIKNFFFGSFFGMAPQIFIWVSLGSGLEKVINENLEAPSLKDLFFLPDIYIPIIGFIFLLLLGIFVKNLFYKN